MPVAFLESFHVEMDFDEPGEKAGSPPYSSAILILALQAILVTAAEEYSYHVVPWGGTDSRFWGRRGTIMTELRI